MRYVRSKTPAFIYSISLLAMISILSGCGIKIEVSPSPMLLTPSSDSVSIYRREGTIQFSASGGVPPYRYEVVSGPGSIDSSGAYRGARIPGTTVIRVHDTLGATADSTLTAVDGSMTTIDGGAAAGLNQASGHDAFVPEPLSYSSAPYVVWSERGGGTGSIWQIRVKHYSNGAWSWDEGGGVNGINKDPTKSALTPHTLVFESNLYVTWTENNAGGVGQVRVAVYDGASSWTFVDGDGANGLNQSTARAAENPRLIEYQNSLYVIWDETDGTAFQVRAKKYLGAGTWASVDGGGATGLNFDVTRIAKLPHPVVLGSYLYVSWQEATAGATQIRVARYDGTSWSFVDGGGPAGINVDSARTASAPRLAAQGSNLYATWIETNGAVNQLRAARYDGTSWSLIDGGGSSGLNLDASKAATTPFLYVFDEHVYLVWAEDNGTANQLRLAVYSGGAWTTLTTGSSGLNYDPTKTAGNAPRLTTDDGYLHLFWAETDGAKYQIRAGKFQ